MINENDNQAVNQLKLQVMNRQKEEGLLIKIESWICM